MPGVSTCTTCEDGFYCSGGIRRRCPEGSFCPANSDTYTICDSGYYSAEGASSCTLCEAGYQCPDTKASSKQACTNGYYSEGKQTSCSECPGGRICTATGIGSPCSAGKYVSAKVWADVCTMCSTGTYTLSDGSATCTSCPGGKLCTIAGEGAACTTGTYTLPGIYAVTCTSCPGGKECTAQGPGNDCPSGTYLVPNTWGSCVNCPGGFTCQPTGRGTQCLPGTYAPSNTWVSPCTKCGPGQYSREAGWQSCNTCPGGRLCSETGEGPVCDAGTYATPNQWVASCTPCANGFYQDQTGKTSCNACPGGRPCNKNFVGAVCEIGTYMPANTWGDSCIPCETGKYQDSTGKNSCISCPGGKPCTAVGTGSICTDGRYALPSVWATSCELCPGTKPCTSNLLGATCETGFYAEPGKWTNVCLLCPGGRPCSPTGPTSMLCPQGTYLPPQVHSPTCTYECQQGYKCPEGSKEPIVCESGTYSDVRSASCTTCEAGYYCPDAKKSSKASCQIGQYSLGAAASCTPCPGGKICIADQLGNDCAEGTYAPPNEYSKICQDCPGGKLCNKQGVSADCLPGTFLAAKTWSDTCTPCQAGYYAANMGQLECTPCKLGQYSTKISSATPSDCLDCLFNPNNPAGSSTCKSQCVAGQYIGSDSKCYNCPAGSYDPQQGAGTSCVMCPAGTRLKYAGAASEILACEKCPVGYFSSEGSMNCSPCQPGYYSYAIRAAACNKCPLGKYASTTGSTACMDCKQGEYSENLGSIECSKCAVGYYQDLNGQANCKACEVGKYSDSLGSPYCKDCEQGYTSISGSSKCTACPKGTYWSQPLCYKCAPGSTTAVEASLSPRNCVKCPANTKSDLGPNGSQICTPCLAGYYSTEGSSTCLVCNTGCKTCNGPLATDCLTCRDGLGLVISVVNEVETKACGTCPALCGTCKNSSCVECMNGAELKAGGVCECKTGYLKDTQTNTCTQCSTNCKSCELSVNNCTACNPGYFLEWTIVGRGSLIQTCLPCHSNCKQCNGPGPENCTECAQTGMVLVENKCKCTSGFYESTIPGSDTKICSKCHILSARCFGPNPWESYDCNTALQNIGPLFGTTCSCQEGYYFTGENCTKCDSYCQTCNGTASNCLRCLNQPGIKYDNRTNKCYCDTSSNYYEKITWTGSNFTIPLKSCEKCHPLVQKCIGPNPWEALECKNITGIDSINSTNCFCKDGYFYEPKNVGLTYSNLCQKCKKGCDKCNGTSTTCLVKTPEPVVSQAATTSTTAVSTASAGVIAVSSIATGGSMASLAQISDSAQFSLMYEDLKLPYKTPEMKALYKGMSIFRLDFVPNVVAWGNPYSGNNSTSKRLLLAPGEIEDYEDPPIEERVFLLNIGNLISLMIIIAVIYPIIILISCKVELFMKIRKQFEWSGFFAIILFNSYQTLRAVFIQFKYFSHSEGTFYTLSCYAAICAFLFYLGFIGLMVWVLMKPTKELETDEAKQKFGCFYNTNQLDNFGRYTSVIELLRKLIVVALIELLNRNAWHQCLAILIGTAVILCWYLVAMPRKSGFAQFSTIASEFINMFTTFGFLSLSFYIDEKDIPNRIKFVVVSFIAGPVIVAVTTIAEQITMLIRKMKECCNPSHQVVPEETQVTQFHDQSQAP